MIHTLLGMKYSAPVPNRHQCHNYALEPPNVLTITACQYPGASHPGLRRARNHRFTVLVFKNCHYHPSRRNVAIVATEKLPGSPATSVPRKLGFWPETRTVRMLPANPPGDRIATPACLIFNSQQVFSPGRFPFPTGVRRSTRGWADTGG